MSTLAQTQNLLPALVTGAVAATSTASTAVATGAELDATQFGSVAYSISVATNAVKWSVFGANVSDYSDESAVQAATTVAAGAIGTYAATAAFRFYRVKLIDDAGGSHGVATINGRAF
jgi:hypothetical protein